MTEFDPYESALERLVGPDKHHFIGREALLRKREAGPRWRFVPFEVD